MMHLSWDSHGAGRDHAAVIMQDRVALLERQGREKYDQTTGLQDTLAHLETSNRQLQSYLGKLRGSNTQLQQVLTNKTSSWQEVVEGRLELLQQHHVEVQELRRSGIQLVSRLEGGLQDLQLLGFHEVERSLENVLSSAASFRGRRRDREEILQQRRGEVRAALSQVQTSSKQETSELESVEEQLKQVQQEIQRVEEEFQHAVSETEGTSAKLLQISKRCAEQKQPMANLQQKLGHVRQSCSLIQANHAELKADGGELVVLQTRIADQQRGAVDQHETSLQQANDRSVQLEIKLHGLLQQQTLWQARLKALEAALLEQQSKQPQAATDHHTQTAAAVEDDRGAAIAAKQQDAELQNELRSIQESLQQLSSVVQDGNRQLEEARAAVLQNARRRDEDLNRLRQRIPQLLELLELLETAEQQIARGQRNLRELHQRIRKDQEQDASFSEQLAAATEQLTGFSKQASEERKKHHDIEALEAELNQRQQRHTVSLDALNQELSQQLAAFARRNSEVAALSTALYSLNAAKITELDEGSTPLLRAHPSSRRGNAAVVSMAPASVRDGSRSKTAAAEKPREVPTRSAHSGTPTEPFKNAKMMTPRKRNQSVLADSDCISPLRSRRGKRLRHVSKQQEQEQEKDPDPPESGMPADEVFVPQSPSSEVPTESSFTGAAKQNPQSPNPESRAPASVAVAAPWGQTSRRLPQPPPDLVSTAAAAAAVMSTTSGNTSGLRRRRRSKRVSASTAAPAPEPGKAMDKENRNPTSWFDDDDLFSP